MKEFEEKRFGLLAFHSVGLARHSGGESPFQSGHTDFETSISGVTNVGFVMLCSANVVVDFFAVAKLGEGGERHISTRPLSSPLHAVEGLGKTVDSDFAGESSSSGGEGEACVLELSSCGLVERQVSGVQGHLALPCSVEMHYISAAGVQHWNTGETVHLDLQSVALVAVDGDLIQCHQSGIWQGRSQSDLGEAWHRFHGSTAVAGQQLAVSIPH